MPEITDWIQAVSSVLTLVATIYLAWAGWTISKNQLRPFLYIHTDWGCEKLLVQIKNAGLGPAKILNVEYRLATEYHKWRQDGATDGYLLGDRNAAANLLLPHIDADLEPSERFALYLADTPESWQGCRLNGSIIKPVDGQLELLEFHARSDDKSRLWLHAVMYTLHNAQVRVTYEGIGGSKEQFVYKFSAPVDQRTMPCSRTWGAAAAAAKASQQPATAVAAVAGGAPVTQQT